jgi:hypothetical protein
MKTLALTLVLLLSGCIDTYEYEPAVAGDEEGDREPRSKTSSQFLRGVYADLLGRTPETFEFVLQFDGVELFRIPLDEESQLATVLDGIGDPLPMRNLIVQGLLHGKELQLPDKAAVADGREFIGEQFRKLLGREPNVYELETFAGEWDSDAAVGPRTIIRAIVGSREYQSQ